MIEKQITNPQPNVPTYKTISKARITKIGLNQPMHEKGERKNNPSTGSF